MTSFAQKRDVTDGSFRCLDFFVIVVFLSYLRTSWSRRDVDALRWRCGSVTWCRPSVPPSALTHHLVANKQTLQRRQHFYHTTTGDTCTTGCLSNTLQRFATSATTPLHHTGWLNCHIWGSEEAKPGPLAPSQNGKLTTPLIHRVNLVNNFFYHLSNSRGSSPVLQLLTKVVVFLLLFWGDSMISSNG